MDEDRVSIPLRPDGGSYVMVAAVVIVSGMLVVHALDPVCHYKHGGCTMLETYLSPAIIVLCGLVLSFVLLRRQVLILDPEGLRRRTGRREKLVRWTEMSLITEYPAAGKRYPPAVVVGYGVGRLLYLYDSYRISGRDLFRPIDRYVTTHSIKAATKAL